MITRVTGTLLRLTEESAEIGVGAFEYQVMVPEFVRRQLQPLVGEEVSLRTIQYLDGNPQQGRLTPRIVGFMHDAERQFFELVCSVDGVGVKKALRAMVRPVREVATAIEEQDVKQLTTLPGVGPAVAERIIAKLRRKMARFALMVSPEFGETESKDLDLLNEACQALVALGHSAGDARRKVESVADRKLKTVEAVLMAVYQNER